MLYLKQAAVDWLELNYGRLMSFDPELQDSRDDPAPTTMYIGT